MGVSCRKKNTPVNGKVLHHTDTCSSVSFLVPLFLFVFKMGMHLNTLNFETNLVLYFFPLRYSTFSETKTIRLTEKPMNIAQR